MLIRFFKNRLRCIPALAILLCAIAFVMQAESSAQLPGEGAALQSVGITQEQIVRGEFTLQELRTIGRRIFATPLRKQDGYGDGPHDEGEDPTIFGGRPTLQNNGTFLRVNGLDGQSCAECHFALSSRDVPMTFGIGGFAGSNSNAMFAPTDIDVDDSDHAGFAGFNGRFINPLFLFGVGGVELVGKEMTADLQALKQVAVDQSPNPVRLDTKGVNFGTLSFVDGAFDYSGVVGIDHDLVVKPFGRKGEFATTRAFDVAAFQFHFGIQTLDDVPPDTDPDGDGVVNELLVGELSAVVVFNTTLERPRQTSPSKVTRQGETVFTRIGCADCHIPQLTTKSRFLTYSFPEDPANPFANVFFQTDLTREPTGFQAYKGRGIVVPMFSDLKRHDMGPGLAESFGSDLDSHFITAKLWGVADSGPYLHDGRALTIGEAIALHGGEAEAARNRFLGLNDPDKGTLLSFLLTLRTPEDVGADLDE